ncbi:hypothetical protein G6F56_010270 [Rhizopus delemar]|nr:hypothetical protein G6F56_010270 [Rhizopus delemar]
MTSQSTMLAIQSGSSQDNTKIKVADLPILNVKPTSVLNLEDDGISGGEASNSKYFKWFNQNIKLSMEKQKKKLSWSAAEDLMRTRFDLASIANVIQCNSLLRNLKQNPNETLAEYLDRFRSYMVAANANTEDNLFLSCHFLLSLYSKEFRDVVEKTLTEHHSRTRPFILPGSTMGESQYAVKCDTLHVPKNFSLLEDVLNANIVSLEKALDDIQRSAQKLKANNGQSGDSNKKRKFAELGNQTNISNSTNKKVQPQINWDKLYDLSYKLNRAELDHLRSKNLCMSCRKVQYSPGHAATCEERKKFLQNKVNTQSSSFNVSSVETRQTEKSTPTNIDNSIECYSNDVSFRNNYSDDDFDVDISDNEYQQAMNDLDRNIVEDLNDKN